MVVFVGSSFGFGCGFGWYVVAGFCCWGLCGPGFAGGSFTL